LKEEKKREKKRLKELAKIEALKKKSLTDGILIK